MKNSLLLRLTILYTLAFAGVSAIGFGVIYYRIYAVAIGRIDSELRQEALEFSELLNERGFEAVREEIAEESRTEDPEEEFYRLLNLNSGTLVSTDTAAWKDLEALGIDPEIRAGRKTVAVETVKLARRGVKARVIAMAIGPSEVIQIGLPLDETEEYLDIFRNLFVILIVIFICLSTIIGWFLAKRALTDMEEVSQAAEEIARGAYDRRVNIKGKFREIERLGATFNAMLDRIQALLNSMRQTNDDIAHDLKSPLARVRGIAEMTLLKKPTIQTYEEMAVNTIEECDTLIEMINTMLDIAEIESGVYNAKIEKFELPQLISEACELFRPLPGEKKINLQLEMPASLPFRGDRKRMQRIVANILENSIKYSPANGTVVVCATKKSGSAQIDFKDHGPGIPQTDLPHIFKRFYRCDKSRSQNGSGLGLSLVKAYVESMKGRVEVKSRPDQGSTFTLLFPDNPE